MAARSARRAAGWALALAVVLVAALAGAAAAQGDSPPPPPAEPPPADPINYGTASKADPPPTGAILGGVVGGLVALSAVMAGALLIAGAVCVRNAGASGLASTPLTTTTSAPPRPHQSAPSKGGTGWPAAAR